MTPLAMFLPVVFPTINWAQAGQDTVIVILLGLALWVWFKLAARAAIAEERRAEMHDLELVLGVAKFIEKRDREKVEAPPTVEDDSDDDLGFLLRRSIEMTKPDNAA